MPLLKTPPDSMISMLDISSLKRNRALLSLFVILGGCVHNNPPPPSVIHSDMYSAIVAHERKIPLSNKVFTVEDAIRIGLANNPSYERTKLSLQQAYNNLYSQIAGYFPANITANAGTNKYVGGSGENTGSSYSGSGGGSSTGSWQKTGTLTIDSNIILFNGLQREMNLLQSSELIDQQDYAMKFARLTLINQIQRTYYYMVYNKTRVDIAGADADFQKMMLDFELEKRKLNLVTDDSVMNFEFKLEMAKRDLVRANSRFLADQYTLAALMGLTTVELPDNLKLMSIAEVMETIQIGFEPLGVEYYLDMAIQQNPNLKQSRSALMASRYQLYSSWGSFSPTITADAGYSWGVSNQSSEVADGGNYGLNATWDLWNNQRPFTIRGNAINVNIQEQSVYETWIRVVQDVRTAYSALESSILEQKITQKAYNIAMRQRVIVQSKYEVKVESIARMNQVQDYLVQAENDNAQAIVDIYIAKAELEKACGIQRY